MKRPLLVFAGQSNMMGAAVYPAQKQIEFCRSAEYLHKPRRWGASSGEFKHYGFPTGEFSYQDLDAAYGAAKDAPSRLADYTENTYFCPSMCNLKSEEGKETFPFKHFSEADNRMAVSLAPIIVRGLEEQGLGCAYTHIAKGAVSIRHYLEGAAAAYFDRKAADFFTDAAARYAGDDTSRRALIWLQGESDLAADGAYYKQALGRLWARCKAQGFNVFLIVRVGYWEDERIAGIMQAQEEFCAETEDAFILTRACSYLHHPLEPSGWLSEDLGEEFSLCRDSYFGFPNHHINEKGFETIASFAVPNLIRTLWEGKEPLFEEEAVAALKKR